MARFRYTAVGSDVCNELLATWQVEQIFNEPIPAHWSSDFQDSEYDDGEDIQWWRYLCTMDGGSIAWEMEHTAHYYGTLYLLLYCERDRVAIFKKGGLLFLCIQDTDQVFIARSGMTATGLALAWNENRLTQVVAREIGDGLVHSAEVSAFFMLSEWEKCTFGRNRWAEFRARGGDVGRDFLSNELYVAVDRVE